MNLVLLTALGLSFATLLLGVVFVLSTRVRFVVELHNGVARVRRGDPPSSFVRGCSDVARVYRLTQGTISGIRTGSGIELRFSPDIPKRVQQPFRNIWEPPASGPGGGRSVA